MQIYDASIDDDKFFKNLVCDVDFGREGHAQNQTTFNVVGMFQQMTFQGRHPKVAEAAPS